MKGTATGRYGWSSEPNRPAEEKTMEVFLREAAQAGYDAVENVGEDIGAVAPRFGLKVCGGYVGAPAHLPWHDVDPDGEVMAAAQELAAAGAEYLNINCNPKGAWDNRERKTEDELKLQGDNLTKLAEQIAPLELELVMHNHANSYDLHVDDLRSVTEFAGESVGVCLDTGWSLTSGDEPVARIRALGPRLRALHLRNQWGEKPTEWLGEGDTDMAECIAALKEIGYDGWLTTEIYYRADTDLSASLVDNQTRTVAMLRELWGE